MLGCVRIICSIKNHFLLKYSFHQIPMKLLPLLVLVCVNASSVCAQSTLTEKLRKHEKGKGTVIITQSEQIEQIINNTVPNHTPQQTSSKDTVATEHLHSTNKPQEDSKLNTKKGSYATRGRHKARGYRICIFTGGNSRKDKTKAIQMGEKCRKKFPELSIYTSFIAPRWVTNVGDFKNRQDAQKYVNLIRSAHFTYEVRIVSSEVNLPY